MITWAQIDTELQQGDYRDRAVALFRKYEGQDTDERDRRGCVVKVTAASFARRYGIQPRTFRIWGKGNSYPSPKPKQERPTREQVDRRRDHAVALRKQGCSRPQIAQALGVSEAVIGKDLEATGCTDASQPQRTARQADPEPFDWRTPTESEPMKPRQKKKTPPSPPAATPPPVRVPLYRRSTTRQLWRDTLKLLTDDNAVNRFANDAHEADTAGDDHWFQEARRELQDLRAYLDRLDRVLNDLDARKRGIEDPRERDDVGPRLRLVGEGKMP
jgi:hypothetical protein